jgi:hypothetical protein
MKRKSRAPIAQPVLQSILKSKDLGGLTGPAKMSAALFYVLGSRLWSSYKYVETKAPISWRSL